MQTVYSWQLAGQVYRQPEEARWAAFFRALEIPWQYHLGGLVPGTGIWRASGFWLPAARRWIEVRDTARPLPPDFHPLHPRWAALGDEPAADGAAARLVIIYGSPHFVSPAIIGAHRGYPTAHAGCVSEDFLYASFTYSDDSYVWTECPRCGRIGIEYEGRAGRLCDCFPADDKVYNSLSPRLVRAYAQAWEAPLRPCVLWRGLLALGPYLGLERG